MDLIIDKNGIKQLSNPQNNLTKFKIIPANMVVLIYLKISKNKQSEKAPPVLSAEQFISLMVLKLLSQSNKLLPLKDKREINF